MSAAKDDTMTVEIAQLKITTQHLATLIDKISESMEGTARTPGMKEKLTIARYDIELNKQAYQAVMDELKRTEERLGKSLFELSSKIDKSLIDLSSKIDKKIDEKFTTLQTDNEKQNTALQKIQPWVNGISWFLTVAGGIIVSLLLTGKLDIAFR